MGWALFAWLATVRTQTRVPATPLAFPLVGMFWGLLELISGRRLMELDAWYQRSPKWIAFPVGCIGVVAMLVGCMTLIGWIMKRLGSGRSASSDRASLGVPSMRNQAKGAALTFRTWLAIPVLGLAAGSCGSANTECLLLPCAIPLAISLDVSSSSGESVASAVVQVSGAINGTNPCSTGQTSTTCYVMGTAGTYQLAVMAPGFRTAHRTVTVSGSSPPCGCPTANEQHLSIVLVRTTQAVLPSKLP
jgi:hypothetical protein